MYDLSAPDTAWLVIMLYHHLAEAECTISYYQPHNTRCHAEAVMMIMMRAVIMIGA